jgi:serine/threonine-protein kinase
MPLRPGDKLADQYQIESVLGQGGFGQVYLARDLSLGALRVIKEPLTGRFGNEETQKRLMAQLAHTNIVAIYQLLTPPLVRDYYIVMEYIAGGSLDHLLHREGRLSVDRAVKIVIDVCRGLAQAHKQGIVHRNIKPANIFLSEDKDIAKVGGWSTAYLPNVKEVIYGQPGTWLYPSPEQIRASL